MSLIDIGSQSAPAELDVREIIPRERHELIFHAFDRRADILAPAQPLPGARFVRVAAGNYVLPLPLGEAEGAVLCDELNGQPLEVEHGAPWRLIVPGAACYASVKWVDRLELAPDAGEKSAQTIARARLA